MRNGTQRSAALQALMSPGSMWFSGLNTFAFIQFARRPYFIKVKRLPSCASNNHVFRQSLWFSGRWKPCLLWLIWTGTIVCKGRKRKDTRGEKTVSELVLAELIPASHLALRWPQPPLLQPDDWFLFGAMPMGLIKSKCKLTLITNCRENASSQLPLKGGPGLLWQVKNPMSFPELSSPAHTAYIFHLNPTEIEDFSISLFICLHNALHCVFISEMDRSITSTLDELILLVRIIYLVKGWNTLVYSSVP